MEKIKLEKKTPNNKSFEYDDSTITVDPLITVSEKTFLINKYLSDYFESDANDKIITKTNYNLIKAEYNLIIYLVQLKSNIDATILTEDLDYYSSLIDMILSNISNYGQFRKTLDRIVSDVKEEILIEKSIGNVIDNLFNKALLILDKFSDYDVEKIKEAKEAGLELMNELRKSNMLSFRQDLEEQNVKEEATIKTTRAKKKVN